MLEIIPVVNSQQLDAFIRFEWEIYQGDPYWVPPTRSELKKKLSRETGPFFKTSDLQLYLAKDGKRILGRIAAIRNQPHLDVHDDSVGFFGFFECVDDTAVAGALLEVAEDWLVEQDLCVCRGPADFSIYDPAGVTVDGHAMRPGVGMAYTPAYYAKLLEENGYHKVRDLYAYHLDRAAVPSDLMELEQYSSSVNVSGFVVRTMDLKNLADEAEIFGRIFTAAWRDCWGSLPLLTEDFIEAARELGPFLKEDLGYVVEYRNQPVGIFLAIPDPWEILQTADGKLGLSALFKILTKRNKIKHYRVILMGVLPDFQMSAATPLMLKKFYEVLPQFPYMETIEFSWILEDNQNIRKLLETVGAKPKQTFRLYDKFI